MAIISATDTTGQAPIAPTKQPHSSNNAEAAGVISEAPEVKKTEAEAMSPKFAALARKEKALYAQMRSLKAREDAFKSKEAEYQSAYIPKSKIAEDPLSILADAGINYDQLTQLILNQSNPENAKFSQLQKELQSIKEAQSNTLTQLENQKNEQYEQAKKQISTEVKLLVDGDESFETIKAMKQESAVVELIEQIFNEQGYLMPIEEAAKEVEEYLLEEAFKITKLKKLQSRITPQLTPPAQAEQKPTLQKPGPQTLSNRLVERASQPLTDKARRERAILAFQGKLT